MTDIKSALRTIGGGYLLYIAWQLLTAPAAILLQKILGGVLGLPAGFGAAIGLVRCSNTRVRCHWPMAQL